MSQGILRDLRVFEAVRQIVEKTRSSQQGGEDNSQGGQVRVPGNEYQANLKSMILAASEHNCHVLLVTAPTLFAKGKMPQWTYPFFRQYYRMSPAQVAAVPELHKSYNNIVRKLSQAEQGTTLADLATNWKPDTSRERFRHDHIHLTEKGHRDAASFLFEVWRKNRETKKQGASS